LRFAPVPPLESACRVRPLTVAHSPRAGCHRRRLDVQPSNRAAQHRRRSPFWPPPTPLPLRELKTLQTRHFCSSPRGKGEPEIEGVRRPGLGPLRSHRILAFPGARARVGSTSLCLIARLSSAGAAPRRGVSATPSRSPPPCLHRPATPGGADSFSIRSLRASSSLAAFSSCSLRYASWSSRV
jgi:hypothetical protein